MLRFQAFELAWGRSLSSCCLRDCHHRCRHVEQEPGVEDQAAGDVGDVAILDLEANGDDLKEEPNDPALLEDHHAVHQDPAGVLHRRAGTYYYIDYTVCRHPSLCE